MVTAFRANELSSEIRFKNFLRDVFLDDAIASLIAKRLAEKEPEERVDLVTSLSLSSNTPHHRWDALIGKVK